ncbi:MAG: response regulator transcription factor [Elusimicrobia bacterium]|nr:response regulator transcription factor [Elusimicrobiota bacterium]
MLIMIADDDQMYCGVLKDFLESRGHQVVTVHDGGSAAMKALEWKPQLIILDIQMPGGYGTSAYQVLEREGVTKTTPVIFCSAVPPERARKILPPEEKAPLVSKPIDLKRLEALISALPKA